MNPMSNRTMRAAMMFLFSISISLCLQTTYAAQVSGRHTNRMGVWVDISLAQKEPDIHTHTAGDEGGWDKGTERVVP